VVALNLSSSESAAAEVQTEQQPNTATTASTTTEGATKASSLLSSIVPDKSVIQSAGSVFCGVVATFLLNNYAHVGPIRASSIVGLIATLALPESYLQLKLAAFCGSFAGMAKLAVIPGIGHSVILGIVTAIVMAIFDRQKWLVGMGGRLGFVSIYLVYYTLKMQLCVRRLI
jgi:hypothetical protein